MMKEQLEETNLVSADMSCPACFAVNDEFARFCQQCNDAI